ncbi:MAG: hypothetical protein J7L42_06300 [Elusimicrobia bacterium]|nr:hypothetical protein [Elusimicrobiota bacterium]
MKKLIISRKVEKLKSEKGNPLLFLPPFRGEIERGDLWMKNYSKVDRGQRIEERKKC